MRRWAKLGDIGRNKANGLLGKVQKLGAHGRH
jgi:hypothetical protein